MAEWLRQLSRALPKSIGFFLLTYILLQWIVIVTFFSEEGRLYLGPLNDAVIPMLAFLFGSLIAGDIAKQKTEPEQPLPFVKFAAGTIVIAIGTYLLARVENWDMWSIGSLGSAGSAVFLTVALYLFVNAMWLVIFRFAPDMVGS